MLFAKVASAVALLYSVTAASTLYADSKCNSNLCLSVIYSPSEQVMNMSMTATGGGAPIGWYGVGTGSKMAGSNMMIGWVDTGGAIRMSQRTTTSGHNDPTTSYTAKAATMDTSASMSNSTSTQWLWSFPMSSTDATPGSKTSFIWAVNKADNPAASDSASLKQHKSYGTFTLDLTKPYTAATANGSTGTTAATPATASSASTSSDSGADEDVRALGMSNNLIIAHMVFMILAWLILVPAAILVARYGRLLFAWFPVHRNIQLVSIVFVVIGFILICVEVGDSEHFDSQHAQVGLAIFIIMFLQALLGLLGHRTKRFHVSRIVHVVVGLGVTVLAFNNVTTGLELWDWGVPKWATYVVWAWAAVLMLTYLIGLIFLRKDIQKHKQQGEKDSYSGPSSDSHLAGESPSSDTPMTR